MPDQFPFFPLDQISKESIGQSEYARMVAAIRLGYRSVQNGLKLGGINPAEVRVIALRVMRQEVENIEGYSYIAGQNYAIDIERRIRVHRARLVEDTISKEMEYQMSLVEEEIKARLWSARVEFLHFWDELDSLCPPHRREGWRRKFFILGWKKLGINREEDFDIKIDQYSGWEERMIERFDLDCEGPTIEKWLQRARAKVTPLASENLSMFLHRRSWEKFWPQVAATMKFP